MILCGELSRLIHINVKNLFLMLSFLSVNFRSYLCLEPRSHGIRFDLE